MYCVPGNGVSVTELMIKMDTIERVKVMKYMCSSPTAMKEGVPSMDKRERRKKLDDLLVKVPVL